MNAPLNHAHGWKYLEWHILWKLNQFKGLLALARRLSVVPKLRIFLSLLLLGSVRWGYACYYWRPDHNNKRLREIPILGTTASLTAGKPLTVFFLFDVTWLNMECVPVLVSKPTDYDKPSRDELEGMFSGGVKGDQHTYQKHSLPNTKINEILMLYVCKNHTDDDVHSDHSYLDTLGIPLNSTLNT